jgi:hypothetical protein
LTTNELKLAIIGGDYPPSNSPRAIRIFNLVSGLAPYFGSINVYLPQAPLNQTKSEINVNFYSFGRNTKFIFSGKIGRILLRIFNLIFDYPDIKIFFWLRNFRHILDSDVILTIGVPHSIHWGINNLLRSNNKQIYWIAESSDPFFTKGMDIFPKPFYFRFLERSFLKRVDKVIVPFEGAITAYPSFARSKFRVIPQGFDGEYISSFQKEKVNNAIFTFGYAGTLYKFGRNPSGFLKKVITSKMNFRFYLIVNNLDLIPSECFSDERFIIQNLMPRVDVYGLLAGMDCILNFENHSKTQSPSKIIEYSFLGRPIFTVNLDTDGDLLIDELISGTRDPLAINSSEYDSRLIIEKYISVFNK